MLKIARRLTRNFANQKNRLSLAEGEYIDGIVKNKTSGQKISADKQESSRLVEKLIDQKVNRNKVSEGRFFDNIDSEFEAFKKKFELSIQLDDNIQDRAIGRPEAIIKHNEDPNRKDSHELKFSLKLRERLNIRTQLNDVQEQFFLDQDVTKKLENKLQKKVNVSKETQIESSRNPIAQFNQIERKKIKEKVYKDNVLIKEFINGEEGTDFINPPDDKQSFQYQMGEHYWETLKESLKDRDPKLYHELNKNGMFPEIHPKELMKDFSKMPPYPGSEKGPDPEDDPDYFKQWVFEHMPPPLKETFEKANQGSNQYQNDSNTDGGYFSHANMAVEEENPALSVKFIFKFILKFYLKNVNVYRSLLKAI